MSHATRKLLTGLGFIARDQHPGLTIIARGEDPSTERKLLQAGANRVVLPAHIGAERISHLILFPESTELIDDAEKAGHLKQELGDLGLELEEAVIPPYSPFIGKSVGDFESLHAGAVIVVALHRKGGGTELRPKRDNVASSGRWCCRGEPQVESLETAGSEHGIAVCLIFSRCTMDRETSRSVAVLRLAKAEASHG